MANRRSMLGVLLAIALLASSASASLAQPAVSGASPAPAAAPGSMLMVENAGQWPAAARFQVWNSPLGAGTTWLAEHAIWLVVGAGERESGRVGVEDVFSPSPSRPITPSSQIALKLTFPGSNPYVRIEPFAPADTTVNYFIGNDPAQWRPDVPVWHGVRYVDLYPGVDLVLGGAEDDWRLEAEPGAAVELVRLQVEGAEVENVERGVLNLRSTGQQMAVALPSTEFGFEIVGSSRLGTMMTSPVSTSVGTIQRTIPLDDSSDLLFGTFLGATDWDFVNAIAVDASGNSFVAGGSLSTNFPTTPGALFPYSPSFYGRWSAFAAKLNPTGTELVYASYLGGRWDDFSSAIAIDSLGNAYLTGQTKSPDFPVTPQAFDTSYNHTYPCRNDPCSDAFVTKLNPHGTALIFSTYLGSTGEDSIGDVVAHSSGDVYVVGSTTGVDFPTTPGAFDRTFNGGLYDSYLVKLDATGSILDYGTFIGGSDWDGSGAIFVDTMGNAYLTGSTTSSDYPTTSNALSATNNGGIYDGFVTSLSPDGSHLRYSTFLGGSDGDYPGFVATDASGNIIVAGYTFSTDFPVTPNAYAVVFSGGADVFVAKISASGDELYYSTLLGGNSWDISRSFILDAAGNTYVTGVTQSVDFPTTPGSFDRSYNANNPNYGDVFIGVIDSLGEHLVYSTFMGGGGYTNEGRGVAVTQPYRVHVTGITEADSFPTTQGAFDTSRNGSSDGFVVRLDAQPYITNMIAPIEEPQPGAFLSDSITLRGFAIDQGSSAGTGVDTIHIYLDGPYGTGTIIGGAAYGLNRTDVAAEYGERFGPSGWELDWDTSSVTPGPHWLYLYAHRTTDNAWSLMPPHLVVVAGGHTVWFPLTTRR